MVPMPVGPYDPFDRRTRDRMRFEDLPDGLFDFDFVAAGFDVLHKCWR